MGAPFRFWAFIADRREGDMQLRWWEWVLLVALSALVSFFVARAALKL